jgi:hypothetical protein
MVNKYALFSIVIIVTSTSSISGPNRELVNAGVTSLHFIREFPGTHFEGRTDFPEDFRSVTQCNLANVDDVF